MLIVNTASKCGFTPQYEGLEALYRQYADKGVCGAGLSLQPVRSRKSSGNADEIKTFCSLTYDVTFPMFSKIDVNGPKAHPLYEYLKHEKKGLSR